MEIQLYILGCPAVTLYVKTLFFLSPEDKLVAYGTWALLEHSSAPVHKKLAQSSYYISLVTIIS